jgi:deoxyribodipyrimidine photo-lyase
MFDSKIKSKKENISIFWFRRDLRLFDNNGLFHALTSGLKVLPVFIFDKNILEKLSDKNDARVSFIHSQIELLNHELKKYNSTIITIYNNPVAAFNYIINNYCVKKVYTNNDYEPYAIKRDSEVSAFLSAQGIDFITFKDHVIFEKGDILKSDGKPYTIFTPYMKQWKLKFTENCCNTIQTEKYFNNFFLSENIAPISLIELGFVKSKLEIIACKVDEEIVRNYESTRNFPEYNTTKLGLHLRFGTVSIRELIKKAFELSNVWLNEIIWREFFQMIMFHFPYSAKNSFKPAYDRIKWRNNEQEFELWCNGKTGYALVDAGMRELNKTGFMHNRIRMVVASFLCKNLLIDWRWGEAYFAEKLLDFDLASNVGNWQWAAGSGCDAAPYFRIFSPTLQAGKFDKNQKYIKKWIPEFGTNTYSKPIIDSKITAKNTIEVYKKALNS